MEAVTLSLEAWLRRCVPDAVLCFEDTRHHAADVALCASLYDVREEERSRGGRLYARDAAESSVSARLQPVRILQHSYRLTAHGSDWLARQRLLGRVISAGAAAPCLPDDVVDASFASFGTGALPLVVAPAVPVPFPQAALTEPPPSPVLHVVVMAPLQPPPDTALAPSPDRVDLGSLRTDSADGAPRRSMRRRRIEERGR